MEEGESPSPLLSPALLGIIVQEISGKHWLLLGPVRVPFAKKSACYELTYLMLHNTSQHYLYFYIFAHCRSSHVSSQQPMNIFFTHASSKAKNYSALNTMFRSTPYNILAYNCGNTGSKILAQPQGTANSHSNWTVQQCTNKAPWKNIEERIHLG